MPDLPIHDLLPPLNDREFRDPDTLDRITASIEAKGFLQPIRVALDPDSGKYRVILGWTRVLCGRRAGKTTIPAVVVDTAPDEADDLLEKVIENDCRGETNPLDKARWYVKIMALRRWNQAELARALHLSPAEVSKTLAVSARLPTDLQEQVAAGRLCPATAYHLSRLPDPAQMRALAEQAVKGLLKRDSVEVEVTKRLGGRAKRTAKPVQVRTQHGIQITIPAGLSHDTVIGDLAAPQDAVRKAVRLGLPLSTLPQLLKPSARPEGTSPAAAEAPPTQLVALTPGERRL